MRNLAFATIAALALVFGCGGSESTGGGAEDADTNLRQLQLNQVRECRESADPEVCFGSKPIKDFIAERRNALRACIDERTNCVTAREAAEGEIFGLTPKVIQACAERAASKVFRSPRDARGDDFAESDLAELIRVCRLGPI
jgi:hypothetical protein